jgi:hypothetical protein
MDPSVRHHSTLIGRLRLLAEPERCELNNHRWYHQVVEEAVVKVAVHS